MIAQAPNGQITTMTSGMIREKSLAVFFALRMHQKTSLGFGLSPSERRECRRTAAMQRRESTPWRRSGVYG